MFPVVPEAEDFLSDPWVMKAVSEGGLGNIREMEFEGMEWNDHYGNNEEDLLKDSVVGRVFESEAEEAEYVLGLLEQKADMVGGVERALDERLRMRVNLSDAMTLENFTDPGPEFKMMGLGTFFANRGRYLLKAGRAEEAFEDLMRCGRLMEFLLKGKSLVSYLAATSSQGVMEEFFLEGVKRKAWNDEHLAELAEFFQGVDWGKAFLDVYPGEVVHGREMVRLTDRYGEDRLTEEVEKGLDGAFEEISEEGEVDDSGFRMEEVWQRTEEALRVVLIPEQYLKDQAARLHLVLLKYQKLILENGGVVDEGVVKDAWNVEEERAWYDEYLSGTMVSALRRHLIVPVKVEARRRLILAAIGVERYRLARGDFPDGLGDLVPGFLDAVPEDPFSDEGLMYEISEDGLPRIGSVGAGMELEYGEDWEAEGQRDVGAEEREIWVEWDGENSNL